MLIQDFVRNNGIKKLHIAECCGISPDTVTDRLKGKGSWKVSELIGLSQALRIPQDEVIKMILEGERYAK